MREAQAVSQDSGAGERKMRTLKTPTPVVLDPTQAAFNLEQLAVYMGIGLWQARTLVWKGKVPALKCGRNYIVRKKDADNFLAGAAAPMPCDSEWMKAREAKASR